MLKLVFSKAISLGIMSNSEFMFKVMSLLTVRSAPFYFQFMGPLFENIHTWGIRTKERKQPTFLFEFKYKLRN